MNPTEILALFDRHQRRKLRERHARREVTEEAIRQVHEGDGTGMVVYSRLTEGNADRVIREQIAAFQALGQVFEWKFYGHDTPGDLKDRLLAHGFEAEPEESVMVLDLQDAPAALLRPVGCDVRRVTDPAQLAAIGPIHQAVWAGTGAEALAERTGRYLEELREALLQDPGSQSIYLAYADGRPVSHARITFHDGDPFAGLWGGSTLAGYRGMGFYTALLAVRLQEARRRGVRFLTLDASAMSRPIVERHGFKFLTRTQPFRWTPSGNPSDLQDRMPR